MNMGGGQGQSGGQGSSDSGWITHPNGTQTRAYSSWSTWSSGGRPHVVEESYASTRGRGASIHTGGGGRGHEEDGSYFESGHIGDANEEDDDGSHRSSGSHDTGWIRLENGTFVRRQSSWSSYGERSYGGMNTLSPEEVKAIKANNDQGHNSTGWVRQPDGTMVHKTSSWSSWSKTSGTGDVDEAELERIRKRLEERTRSSLDNNNNRVPPNVEPGFESGFKHRRAKRSYSEGNFNAELDSCRDGRCTLMRCVVSDLAKGEIVTFKVRSRLFTETQIQVHSFIHSCQRWAQGGGWWGGTPIVNFELTRHHKNFKWFTVAGYPHKNFKLE